MEGTASALVYAVFCLFAVVGLGTMAMAFTFRRRFLERWSHPARLAAETGVAVVLSVAVGTLSAWVGYETLTPSQVGLIAYALSIVTFVAIAVFRLPRHEVSVPALAAAVLLGLLFVLTAGMVLILMIGCRWDACINL